jgi:hypothetical protein
MLSVQYLVNNLGGDFHIIFLWKFLLSNICLPFFFGFRLNRNPRHHIILSLWYLFIYKFYMCVWIIIDIMGVVNNNRELL